MKKIIISILIVTAVLMCCHGNYEPIIGKWEQNTDASYTEAFEITKEGSKYLIDMYTYYRKPTKYIKFNGDTVLMEKGSTNNHKKAELLYDSQKKIYKGNSGKKTIYISILDENNLECRLPFETKTYSRTVSMDIGYLRFGYPE